MILAGRSQSMAEQKEVKFIGASIDDFLRITSEQVKAGKYFDGVTIPTEVREGMSKFVEALSKPTLRARNYVFVWSTHVFVNVEHDVLSKK
jgi:hypothetical protein